jgi:hypothetical protein
MARPEWTGSHPVVIAGAISVARLDELGEEATMTDPDEVTGHALLLAQERRLLRFCAEKGIDPNSPDIEAVT